MQSFASLFRLTGLALIAAEDLRARRETPLSELQADLNDLRSYSAKHAPLGDEARAAAVGAVAGDSIHSTVVPVTTTKGYDDDQPRHR